jgi:DNA-binding phage protein
MDKTQMKSWDLAEHLKTDEDMAAYLEAALQDDDPSLVAVALGDIARAKGMTEVAREASLSGFLCVRHIMSTERNMNAQASQEDAKSQRCRASSGVAEDSAGAA